MNSDRNIPEELAAARQALWDVYSILGFDTDGDPTPAAMRDLERVVVEAARQARTDHDAALAEVEAATVNRCIEAVRAECPDGSDPKSFCWHEQAVRLIRSLLPATPAEQPTTGHNELARAVPQLEEDRETGNRATYAPSPKVAAGEGSSPFRPGNPVEQPTVTDGAGKTFHDRVQADMAGREPDATAKCHCGRPVGFHDYNSGGKPFTRGLCVHCDAVRCDAYPGACGWPDVPAGGAECGHKWTEKYPADRERCALCGLMYAETRPPCLGCKKAPCVCTTQSAGAE